MSSHESNAANSAISGGCTAIELVAAFPKIFPEIREFDFKVYRAAANLQERLEAINDPNSVDALLKSVGEIRQDSGTILPYWHAVLSVGLKSPLAKPVIREALRHDADDESVRNFTLSPSQLNASELGRLQREAQDEGLAIAVYSSCRTTSDRLRHIPMMDFRCDPTDANLDLVEYALKSMGHEAGAILNSGRSFHFFGFDLLENSRWHEHMARASLLNPLVDARYIAHRLLHGAAALRVIAVAEKPSNPTVVRLFGSNFTG